MRLPWMGAVELAALRDRAARQQLRAQAAGSASLLWDSADHGYISAA
jgi:hypothetical protein